MHWRVFLMIGAWFPIILTLGTVYYAGRLLFVPAGAYGAWRWAWTWLMIGVLSIGLFWLRNALVIAGLPEPSWLIQLLLSMPLRVVLSNLAAVGFLGCAWECYRIFRPRPVSAPIPVAQVVMSWRGTIILWNDAAADLLGYSAAEALGQELATLIIPEDLMVPMNGDMVAARDLHRQGLQRFRDTGQSPILDTRFETKALHKDGRHIDVEVRVNEHLTSEGRTFLGQIVPVTKGITG